MRNLICDNLSRLLYTRVPPGKVALTQLPRRPSNHSLPVSRLALAAVPHWRSCPPPVSASGASVWSMAVTPGEAERALVRAVNKPSRSFTITEKAPIKAFSLLKATTGTFTFKNLY